MSEVTSDSLIVVGRSRGGRPRAEEPGYRVSSWVPQRHADELMKLANYNGQSVSEFVRELIVRAVKT